MSRIEQYQEVKYEFAGPDPGRPKPGEMFVFYEDGKPSMVEFLCPCGCDKVIPTHVVPIADKQANASKASHRWGFDETTLTLFPSIRWTSGCLAHFNITNGRTVWHADSGVAQ